MDWMNRSIGFCTRHQSNQTWLLGTFTGLKKESYYASYNRAKSERQGTVD